MLTRSKARRTGQIPPPIFGHARPDLDESTRPRKKARKGVQSSETQVNPTVNDSETITETPFPPTNGGNNPGAEFTVQPVQAPSGSITPISSTIESPYVSRLVAAELAVVNYAVSVVTSPNTIHSRLTMNPTRPVTTNLPLLPPVVFQPDNSGLRLQLVPIIYSMPTNDDQVATSLSQAMMVTPSDCEELMQVYNFLFDIIHINRTPDAIPPTLTSSNLTNLNQNLHSILAKIVFKCMYGERMANIYKKRSFAADSPTMIDIIGPLLDVLPKSSQQYPEFHYICRIMRWFNRANPKVSHEFIFSFYRPDVNSYLKSTLTSEEYENLERVMMDRVDITFVPTKYRQLYLDLLQERDKFTKLIAMPTKNISKIWYNMYGFKPKEKKMTRMECVLLLYSRNVVENNIPYNPDYFDWSDPVNNGEPGLTEFGAGEPFYYNRHEQDGINQPYWFPQKQPYDSINNHHTYVNSTFDPYDTDHFEGMIEGIAHYLPNNRILASWNTEGIARNKNMIDLTKIKWYKACWPQLLALCYELDNIESLEKVNNDLVVHVSDPQPEERIEIMRGILSDRPIIPAEQLYLLVSFPLTIVRYIAHRIYGNFTLLYNRDELITLLSRGRRSERVIWEDKHRQTLACLHMLPPNMVKHMKLDVTCIVNPPCWLSIITEEVSIKNLISLFDLIPPRFGSAELYLANYLIWIGSTYNEETFRNRISDKDMSMCGIMFDIEQHSIRRMRYHHLIDHPGWVVLHDATRNSRHTSDLLEDINESSYTIEAMEQYPLVVLGYGIVNSFFPVTLTELMAQIRATLSKDIVTPIVWPREPRVEPFTPFVTRQLVNFLLEHQRYYDAVSRNNPIARQAFRIYFDAMVLLGQYQERLHISGDDYIKPLFEILTPTQKEQIKELLGQAIRVGWLFRQWDGVSERLPITATETTNLSVNQVIERSAQDTTRLMELVGKLESSALELYKSLICYDFYSNNWVQGQLDTLDRLISQLFTTQQSDQVCIRLGSSLLLFTGKYYLKLLFDIEYDLTGLERIS